MAKNFSINELALGWSKLLKREVTTADVKRALGPEIVKLYASNETRVTLEQADKAYKRLTGKQVEPVKEAPPVYTKEEILDWLTKAFAYINRGILIEALRRLKVAFEAAGVPVKVNGNKEMALYQGLLNAMRQLADDAKITVPGGLPDLGSLPKTPPLEQEKPEEEGEEALLPEVEPIKPEEAAPNQVTLTHQWVKKNYNDDQVRRIALHFELPAFGSIQSVKFHLHTLIDKSESPVVVDLDSLPELPKWDERKAKEPSVTPTATQPIERADLQRMVEKAVEKQLAALVKRLSDVEETANYAKGIGEGLTRRVEGLARQVEQLSQRSFSKDDAEQLALALEVLVKRAEETAKAAKKAAQQADDALDEMQSSLDQLVPEPIEIGEIYPEEDIPAWLRRLEPLQGEKPTGPTRAGLNKEEAEDWYVKNWGNAKAIRSAAYQIGYPDWKTAEITELKVKVWNFVFHSGEYSGEINPGEFDKIADVPQDEPEDLLSWLESLEQKGQAPVSGDTSPVQVQPRRSILEIEDAEEEGERGSDLGIVLYKPGETVVVRHPEGWELAECISCTAGKVTAMYLRDNQPVKTFYDYVEGLDAFNDRVSQEGGTKLNARVKAPSEPNVYKIGTTLGRDDKSQYLVKFDDGSEARVHQRDIDVWLFEKVSQEPKEVVGEQNVQEFQPSQTAESPEPAKVAGEEGPSFLKDILKKLGDFLNQEI